MHGRTIGEAQVIKKTVPLVGEIYKNNAGSTFTVIEHRNSRYTRVRFLDHHSFELVVQSSQVFAGNLRNPYHPTAQGHGYMGEGPHTSKTAPIPYIVWSGMLERCYSDKRRHLYRSYQDCTVSPEWLNFQNFAEWYLKKVPSSQMALDKDLLSEGKAIYSAETCVLLPQDVNTAITDTKSRRGQYPVGVTRKDTLFYASISRGGLRTHLGSYETAEEAFFAYKAAKEAHVQDLADRYKDVLEPRAYKALYEFTVNAHDEA